MRTKKERIEKKKKMEKFTPEATELTLHYEYVYQCVLCDSLRSHYLPNIHSCVFFAIISYAGRVQTFRVGDDIIYAPCSKFSCLIDCGLCVVAGCNVEMALFACKTCSNVGGMIKGDARSCRLL